MKILSDQTYLFNDRSSKLTQTILDTILSCPLEKLSELLNSLNWIEVEIVDLLQWVKVLNRFDDILYHAYRHQLSVVSTVSMPAQIQAENEFDVSLTLAVLYFTSKLLKKAYNKNVYNSSELLVGLLWCNNDPIAMAAIDVLYSLCSHPPVHRGVFAHDTEDDANATIELPVLLFNSLFDMINAYSSSFRLSVREIIDYHATTTSSDGNSSHVAMRGGTENKLRKVLNTAFYSRSMYLYSNIRRSNSDRNKLREEELDEVVMDQLLDKNDMMIIEDVYTSSLSLQDVVNHHIQLGVRKSYTFALLWRYRLHRMQSSSEGCWSVFRCMYKVISILFTVCTDKTMLTKFFDDKRYVQDELIYVIQVFTNPDNKYFQYYKDTHDTGTTISPSFIEENQMAAAAVQKELFPDVHVNTPKSDTNVPMDILQLSLHCLSTIVAQYDEIENEKGVINPYSTIPSALGVEYNNHTYQFLTTYTNRVHGILMALFRSYMHILQCNFQDWIQSRSSSSSSSNIYTLHGDPAVSVSLESILSNHTNYHTKEKWIEFSEIGVNIMFLIANILNITGTRKVLIDEGLVTLILDYLRMIKKHSVYYESIKCKILDEYSSLIKSSPLSLISHSLSSATIPTVHSTTATATATAVTLIYGYNILQQSLSALLCFVHETTESYLIQLLDSVVENVPYLDNTTTFELISYHINRHKFFLDYLDNYMIPWSPQEISLSISSSQSCKIRSFLRISEMVTSTLLNTLSLFMTLISHFDNTNTIDLVKNKEFILMMKKLLKPFYSLSNYENIFYYVLTIINALVQDDPSMPSLLNYFYEYDLIQVILKVHHEMTSCVRDAVDTGDAIPVFTHSNDSLIAYIDFLELLELSPMTSPLVLNQDWDDIFNIFTFRTTYNIRFYHTLANTGEKFASSLDSFIRHYPHHRENIFSSIDRCSLFSGLLIHSSDNYSTEANIFLDHNSSTESYRHMAYHSCYSFICTIHCLLFDSSKAIVLLTPSMISQLINILKWAVGSTQEMFIGLTMYYGGPYPTGCTPLIMMIHEIFHQLPNQYRQIDTKKALENVFTTVKTHYFETLKELFLTWTAYKNLINYNISIDQVSESLIYGLVDSFPKPPADYTPSSLNSQYTLQVILYTKVIRLLIYIANYLDIFHNVLSLFTAQEKDEIKSVFFGHIYMSVLKELARAESEYHTVLSQRTKPGQYTYEGVAVMSSLKPNLTVGQYDGHTINDDPAEDIFPAAYRGVTIGSGGMINMEDTLYLRATPDQSGIDVNTYARLHLTSKRSGWIFRAPFLKGVSSSYDIMRIRRKETPNILSFDPISTTHDTSTDSLHCGDLSILIDSVYDYGTISLRHSAINVLNLLKLKMNNFAHITEQTKLCRPIQEMILTQAAESIIKLCTSLGDTCTHYYTNMESVWNINDKVQIINMIKDQVKAVNEAARGIQLLQTVITSILPKEVNKFPSVYVQFEMLYPSLMKLTTKCAYEMIRLASPFHPALLYHTAENTDRTIHHEIHQAVLYLREKVLLHFPLCVMNFLDDQIKLLEAGLADMVEPLQAPYSYHIYHLLCYKQIQVGYEQLTQILPVLHTQLKPCLPHDITLWFMNKIVQYNTLIIKCKNTPMEVKELIMQSKSYESILEDIKDIVEIAIQLKDHSHSSISELQHYLYSHIYSVYKNENPTSYKIIDLLYFSLFYAIKYHPNQPKHMSTDDIFAQMKCHILQQKAIIDEKLFTPNKHIENIDHFMKYCTQYMYVIELSGLCPFHTYNPSFLLNNNICTSDVTFSPVNVYDRMKDKLSRLEGPETMLLTILNINMIPMLTASIPELIKVGKTTMHDIASYVHMILFSYYTYVCQDILTESDYENQDHQKQLYYHLFLLTHIIRLNSTLPGFQYFMVILCSNDRIIQFIDSLVQYIHTFITEYSGVERNAPIWLPTALLFLNSLYRKKANVLYSMEKYDVSDMDKLKLRRQEMYSLLLAHTIGYNLYQCDYTTIIRLLTLLAQGLDANQALLEAQDTMQIDMIYDDHMDLYMILHSEFITYIEAISKRSVLNDYIEAPLQLHIPQLYTICQTLFTLTPYQDHLPLGRVNKLNKLWKRLESEYNYPSNLQEINVNRHEWPAYTLEELIQASYELVASMIYIDKISTIEMIMSTIETFISYRQHIPGKNYLISQVIVAVIERDPVYLMDKMLSTIIHHSVNMFHNDSQRFALLYLRDSAVTDTCMNILQSYDKNSNTLSQWKAIHERGKIDSGILLINKTIDILWNQILNTYTDIMSIYKDLFFSNEAAFSSNDISADINDNITRLAVLNSHLSTMIKCIADICHQLPSALAHIFVSSILFDKQFFPKYSHTINFTASLDPANIVEHDNDNTGSLLDFLLSHVLLIPLFYVSTLPHSTQSMSPFSTKVRVSISYLLLSLSSLYLEAPEESPIESIDNTTHLKIYTYRKQTLTKVVEYMTVMNDNITVIQTHNSIGMESEERQQSIQSIISNILILTDCITCLSYRKDVVDEEVFSPKHDETIAALAALKVEPILTSYLRFLTTIPSIKLCKITIKRVVGCLHDIYHIGLPIYVAICEKQRCMSSEAYFRASPLLIDERKKSVLWKEYVEYHVQIPYKLIGKQWWDLFNIPYLVATAHVYAKQYSIEEYDFDASWELYLFGRLAKIRHSFWTYGVTEITDILDILVHNAYGESIKTKKDDNTDVFNSGTETGIRYGRNDSDHDDDDDDEHSDDEDSDDDDDEDDDDHSDENDVPIMDIVEQGDYYESDRLSEERGTNYRSISEEFHIRRNAAAAVAVAAVANTQRNEIVDTTAIISGNHVNSPPLVLSSNRLNADCLQIDQVTSELSIKAQNDLYEKDIFIYENHQYKAVPSLDPGSAYTFQRVNTIANSDFIQPSDNILLEAYLNACQSMAQSMADTLQRTQAIVDAEGCDIPTSSDKVVESSIQVTDVINKDGKESSDGEFPVSADHVDDEDGDQDEEEWEDVEEDNDEDEGDDDDDDMEIEDSKHSKRPTLKIKAKVDDDDEKEEEDKDDDDDCDGGAEDDAMHVDDRADRSHIAIMRSLFGGSDEEDLFDGGDGDLYYGEEGYYSDGEYVGLGEGDIMDDDGHEYDDDDDVDEAEDDDENGGEDADEEQNEEDEEGGGGGGGGAQWDDTYYGEDDDDSDEDENVEENFDGYETDGTYLTDEEDVQGLPRIPIYDKKYILSTRYCVPYKYYIPYGQVSLEAYVLKHYGYLKHFQDKYPLRKKYFPLIDTLKGAVSDMYYTHPILCTLQAASADSKKSYRDAPYTLARCNPMKTTTMLYGPYFSKTHWSGNNKYIYESHANTQRYDEISSIQMQSILSIKHTELVRYYEKFMNAKGEVWKNCVKLTMEIQKDTFVDMNKDEDVTEQSNHIESSSNMMMFDTTSTIFDTTAIVNDKEDITVSVIHEEAAHAEVISKIYETISNLFQYFSHINCAKDKSLIEYICSIQDHNEISQLKHNVYATIGHSEIDGNYNMDMEGKDRELQEHLQMSPHDGILSLIISLLLSPHDVKPNGKILQLTISKYLEKLRENFIESDTNNIMELSEVKTIVLSNDAPYNSFPYNSFPNVFLIAFLPELINGTIQTATEFDNINQCFDQYANQDISTYMKLISASLDDGNNCLFNQYFTLLSSSLRVRDSSMLLPSYVSSTQPDNFTYSDYDCWLTDESTVVCVLKNLTKCCILNGVLVQNTIGECNKSDFYKLFDPATTVPYISTENLHVLWSMYLSEHWNRIHIMSWVERLLLFFCHREILWKSSLHIIRHIFHTHIDHLEISLTGIYHQLGKIYNNILHCTLRNTGNSLSDNMRQEFIRQLNDISCPVLACQLLYQLKIFMTCTDKLIRTHKESPPPHDLDISDPEYMNKLAALSLAYEDDKRSYIREILIPLICHPIWEMMYTIMNEMNILQQVLQKKDKFNDSVDIDLLHTSSFTNRKPIDMSIHTHEDNAVPLKDDDNHKKISTNQESEKEEDETIFTGFIHLYPLLELYFLIHSTGLAQSVTSSMESIKGTNDTMSPRSQTTTMGESTPGVLRRGTSLNRAESSSTPHSHVPPAIPLQREISFRTSRYFPTTPMTVTNTLSNQSLHHRKVLRLDYERLYQYFDEVSTTHDSDIFPYRENTSLNTASFSLEAPIVSHHLNNTTDFNNKKVSSIAVDPYPSIILKRVTTTPDQIVSQFIRFIEKYMFVITGMIRQNIRLLDNTLSLLLVIPECSKQLNFELKRKYFQLRMKRYKKELQKHKPSSYADDDNPDVLDIRNYHHILYTRITRTTEENTALGQQQQQQQQEDEEYEDGHEIYIEINRNNILESSYNALHNRPLKELIVGKFHVTFEDEDGVDHGGLTREWLLLLTREIFKPQYALFQKTNETSEVYQPNPLSGANPHHLEFFKLIGRLIGKAILDGHLLDIHFTRAIYKYMLGQPVSFTDFKEVDENFYKSLLMMMNTPIADLYLDELTFSTLDQKFGENITVDFIPDGRNIVVTDENKAEYIRLLVYHRMISSFKEQLEAFVTGFHECVPVSAISIFDTHDLELLISGLPEIDIEDLKCNTKYVGYHINDETIRHFWTVLRSLNTEEKALFIQFVTGTSKVPLGGFASLLGSDGSNKFTIQRAHGDLNLLPTAHTCFNQLDLPAYSTESSLREKLLTAIREGSEGFGFA